jgi:uncharacterized protein with GYD domain
MPKYASMFRYSPEAWRGLVESPSDRADAARDLIERMGGTMESFHLMLGQWDGMVVWEVADPLAAAAINAGVAAHGAIRHVETHQLIAADDVARMLEMAKTAASHFQPFGGAADWHPEYDRLG